MDWASAFFGAFLGISGAFSLTALAIYPIIGRPYLLWGFARWMFLSMSVLAAAVGSFSVSVAGRDFWTVVAEAGIALGAACTGPLLSNYIERSLPLPPTRRVLWWMLPLGLGAAISSFLGMVAAQFHLVHDLLLLGAVGCLIYGLWTAVAAGSRPARYQAFAWGPLIIVALVILSYEVVVQKSLPYWPVAVLVGMVIDFIVTTMGVVDGFMRVKDERDKALVDVLEAQLATALDPLTNIANRRGLEQHFASRNRKRPTGLALVDCDHFKRINDQFGHDVGDQVLCAVAQGLDGDELFVARLGGEEFVLLVYGRNWQEAAERARQRITQAVREAVPELPYPITASAGLAALEENDTLGTVMKRADRALYAAKEAGRNRSLSLTEFRSAPLRLA